MMEAERLQKIVLGQEKELRRLRRLLAVVKIAHAEFNVEDEKLMITVSAVGVDEYHFIDACKPQLEAIAARLLGAGSAKAGDITDSVTGDEAIGGVSSA